MLPLPNNILTRFGGNAEDALLGIYTSQPEHKQCGITSEELMLGLAIAVEGLLQTRSCTVEEAILEALERRCTDGTSGGIKRMAQVITRGKWIDTFLRNPDKDGVVIEKK